MAATLLPAKLTADMLVLADRNFYGFKLRQTACARGAKSVWRAKSNLRLPVQQRLPDGSYLITVFDNADRKRAGQVVRVIDYALQGVATPGQGSCRRVASLLDPLAGRRPWSWPRCTTNAGRSRASSTSSRRTCAPNSTVLCSRTQPRSLQPARRQTQNEQLRRQASGVLPSVNGTHLRW